MSMNESTIREIAVLIAKEQIHENWPTYLFMILLASIACYVGAYLGGYAKRKGENFATKADFSELLSQLKITTQTTEEVKQKLSHEDWATREFKTLKRLKLEELIQAVHETEDWLRVYQNHILFSGDAPSASSPHAKVERITVLYFPELDSQMAAYNQKYRQMIIDVVNTQQQILANGLTTQAAIDTRQGFINAWGSKYSDRLSDISAIETSAKDIMDDLIRP